MSSERRLKVVGEAERCSFTRTLAGVVFICTNRRCDGKKHNMTSEEEAKRYDW